MLKIDPVLNFIFLKYAGLCNKRYNSNDMRSPWITCNKTKINKRLQVKIWKVTSVCFYRKL